MPRKRSRDLVEVEGLRPFQSALRAMGPEWNKEMAKVNTKAAAVVSTEAISKGQSQGGVAAKVTPSIKPGRSGGDATVSIGDAKFPMALGAEFGAKRFPQFKPFRGNQWEGDGGPGYILHPAIKAKRDEFEDLYLQGIDEISAKAFPEGTHHLGKG